MNDEEITLVERQNENIKKPKKLVFGRLYSFFLGPPAWVFIHFYLGNRERRAREYARKQGWLYERSVLEVILEHMLNSLFIIFGIVFCLLFTLPYLSIAEGWKFAKDLCKDVPPSVRTPCAITLYVFLLPLFPLYLLLIFFLCQVVSVVSYLKELGLKLKGTTNKGLGHG